MAVGAPKFKKNFKKCPALNSVLASEQNARLSLNICTQEKTSNKYPNLTAQARMENLIIIRKETKKVRSKEQECYVFHHDDFENEEVYCVKRWVKVNAEGQPEHLFEVQEQNEIKAGAATKFIRRKGSRCSQC